MCFTIGCDPELVTHREGVFVSADNYFKVNSSMGCDGCSSIAEIRPGFSESPIDLTAKIYQILEYGHQKYPELEFFAGHYVDDFALGGHIHISVTPTNEIISQLDTVLYSFSNVVDDLNQRSKREKTGYGKRFAYRKKYYGFEYRTPGSFLLSPSITLVTFTLAKLSVLNWTEEKIDLMTLKGRKHSKTFLQEFKNNLKVIPDDCIEGLAQLEMLITKKVDWNQNILPNWGLAA